MFWSQISSFYLQLITNRAGTFLHFQTRITGVYMIIHCHIHWLWQILGKHVKWGLSKQYSGYRERCGVRSGIQSISGREWPHPEPAVVYVNNACDHAKGMHGLCAMTFLNGVELGWRHSRRIRETFLVR